MRPILATLVVLGAFALPGAVGSAPTAVVVSITPAAPSSADGGPAGRRSYVVAFRIDVAADRECPNLTVDYSYATYFDGRLGLPGSSSGTWASGAPVSSASFDVRVEADPADRVVFNASGTCEDVDGSAFGTSRPVSSKVGVPAHSCDQGPLRVFAATAAARQDLRTPARRVPVRRGQYLWSGYRVWLARRGRLSYGAPECDGFRVSVAGPTSFDPAEYSRRSMGASMELGLDGVADVRGDQHAGGVETSNAAVVPWGRPGAPSRLAHFLVDAPRAGRAPVTRVRGLSGRAYVAGRISSRRRVYGPPLVVGAGQTAVVRCRGRICRPSLG